MSLPLDVAPVIDEFLVSMTVERFPTPTRNALGHMVTGSAVSTPLIGAGIVTTARRHLERLPEADRQRETIVVYTRTATQLTTPDVITLNSKRYQVTDVSDYALQGDCFVTLAQLIETVTL